MLTRWYQAPGISMFDWDRSPHRPSLFDDVLDNIFSQARSVSAGPRFVSRDNGSEIVLRAELPGLEERDLQISVENGTLTVRGERRATVPEGYRVLVRERTPMQLFRAFRLNGDLDVEKAEARLENGVLTIQIPRMPEAQPREIPVKAS